MKFRNFPVGLVAILVLSAALAMCGKDITGRSSGDGGNNGGIAGTPAVSWGVMKKGSVIVNGVTFDDGSAQITHDNSPAGSDLLRDGMNVKVRGKLNSDGATGAAEKIRTESEIRGAVAATAADSVTVLGQQVFVDSRTVYANVAGLSALAAGQSVEVHGIRDPQDRLLATRVEVLEAGSGPPADRLKGVVEAPITGGNPPALTFTLRGLTIVTTDGTLIEPAGSSINPGDSVAVHGFPSGTTFIAGRIDREDLEIAEFEPQESDEFKVEGFVSSFTTATAGFSVGAIATRLTASTRFEGGVAADLVNNMRVEAQGAMAGGVLVADKIGFDDTVRVRANADSAQSANVLGKTVIVTSRTELDRLDLGVAGITAGQGLRVRGFENTDGTITATQIVAQGNPVGINESSVQGVLKDFNASASTVIVLGITINAAGAAAFGPSGDAGPDHPPVTLAQFFSLLTADRAVIKAEGVFSPGPPAVLTAVSIEIE